MHLPSSTRGAPARQVLRVLALLAIAPVLVALAAASGATAPAEPGAGGLGEIAYGLVDQGGEAQILRFDTNHPAVIERSSPVHGLAPGDELAAIAIRPATGELVGLGAVAVYRIDPSTGAAAVIAGDGPQDTEPPPLPSAPRLGFDVDPVRDQARIVTDHGANARIDLGRGRLLTSDGDVAYLAPNRGAGVTPQIVATAFLRSFPGAPATLEYDVDAATGSLVLQHPPDSGRLTSIGRLGVPFVGPVGFDIHTEDGTDIGFAALGDGARSHLATIDLSTGHATDVGAIGPGGTGIVRSLAVVPTPTAALDAFAVPPGAAVAVAAPGLRANDVVPPDTDEPHALLVTPPRHGTVRLEADGAFTFAAEPGFAGTDTFGYALRSDRGQGQPGTVVLRIEPGAKTVAPGPTTAPGPPTTAVPTSTTTAPPAADPTTGPQATSTTTTTSPGASSTTTSTTTTTSSVPGSTSTSTSTTTTTTPAAIGAAPSAGSDAYTATEFTPLAIAAPGVLANDTAPAGSTARLVTAPAHGTLTLAPDGSFTYFPTLGFANGVDSFTYAVGRDPAARARVDLTVVPRATDAPSDDVGSLLAQYGLTGLAAGGGDDEFGAVPGADGTDPAGTDLPRTGSSVLPLIALGLGLLAAGAVTLRLRRAFDDARARPTD